MQCVSKSTSLCSLDLAIAKKNFESGDSSNTGEIRTAFRKVMRSCESFCNVFICSWVIVFLDLST